MASTDPISIQKMAQFIDDVCPSSHISKNEGEPVDNPTWAASTSCTVKLVGECSISDIRRNKCGSNFWHSSQKFPLNSAYREVKPLSSGLYALSCTRLRSISDKFVFGSSHDADQGSTTSDWKIHKDIQMVGILCLRYLSIPLYHYPRPASTKTRLLIPSSISSNFLDFCYLCKRHLDQGNDIFIYRGDRAFCSLECRCDYIILEEQSQMWSSSSSPSKSIIRSISEFNPSRCDL